MNKTKIDWADTTWNPITGCMCGCEYRYAQKQSKRFQGGGYGLQMNMFWAKYKEDAFHPPYVLETPQYYKTKEGEYKQALYPFGFEPTFHKYRLKELKKIRHAQTIFVGSMADMFGPWIPNDWLDKVFDACFDTWLPILSAHRFLFLTKFPSRYGEIIKYITGEERGSEGVLESFDNIWFGTTITNQRDVNERLQHLEFEEGRKFLSIEPLHGLIDLDLNRHRCPVCHSDQIIQENPLTSIDKSWYCDCCGYWEGSRETAHELKSTIEWVIIGAESGSRKGKITPERKWIENIVSQCREFEIPVFMKSSLENIWGKPLIQEFPIWEREKPWEKIWEK